MSYEAWKRKFEQETGRRVVDDHAAISAFYAGCDEGRAALATRQITPEPRDVPAETPEHTRAAVPA